MELLKSLHCDFQDGCHCSNLEIMSSLEILVSDGRQQSNSQRFRIAKCNLIVYIACHDQTHDTLVLRY